MGCILLIKFVSSTFDFKISGNAEEIVIFLVISETGLVLSECGHAWIRSEPRLWHPPRGPAQPPHHVYKLSSVCHCRRPRGKLPIAAYTGRLRPKGVPFSGFWWAPIGPIGAWQLSMAVTAGVIWLCACVSLWPYGFCTCASVLILILLLVPVLVYGIRVGISLVEADEREGQICHFDLPAKDKKR